MLIVLKAAVVTGTVCVNRRNGTQHEERCISLTKNGNISETSR